MVTLLPPLPPTPHPHTLHATSQQQRVYNTNKGSIPDWALGAMLWYRERL